MACAAGCLALFVVAVIAAHGWGVGGILLLAPIGALVEWVNAEKRRAAPGVGDGGTRSRWVSPATPKRYTAEEWEAHQRRIDETPDLEALSVRVYELTEENKALREENAALRKLRDAMHSMSIPSCPSTRWRNEERDAWEHGAETMATEIDNALHACDAACRKLAEGGREGDGRWHNGAVEIRDVRFRAGGWRGDGAGVER